MFKHFLASAMTCAALSLTGVSFASTQSTDSSFASDLGNGYKSFYSQEQLPWIGKTLLAGGILANTDLDQEIQDSYNRNILSDSSDDLAKNAKVIGDPETTLLYFGLAAVNRLACDRDCGAIPEWGDRTAQALLVGLPAVWTSQAILGGARPRHGEGSDWSIFQFEREHAVSGHAYVGAVPFLTAAQMTDNPYAKATFYALSPLTALSRINDQKHYFSQALMGWLYAAKVTEVINSDLQPEDTVVLPYADGDTVLISVIKPF
ncbi:phosphatase PAP2 family protein [Oceanospirillum sp. HFRX-1_2]